MYRDWTHFWRICSFRSRLIRGMAQVSFTAPFYAGVGYGVAWWISLHTQVHDKALIEGVEQWRGRQIGNHEPSE